MIILERNSNPIDDQKNVQSLNIFWFSSLMFMMWKVQSNLEPALTFIEQSYYIKWISNSWKIKYSIYMLHLNITNWRLLSFIDITKRKNNNMHRRIRGECQPKQTVYILPLTLFCLLHYQHAGLAVSKAWVIMGNKWLRILSILFSGIDTSLSNVLLLKWIGQKYFDLVLNEAVAQIIHIKSKMILNALWKHNISWKNYTKTCLRSKDKRKWTWFGISWKTKIVH